MRRAIKKLRSRAALLEYTWTVATAIIYHIRTLVKVNCGRCIATSCIVDGASTAIKSCVAISARKSPRPSPLVAFRKYYRDPLRKIARKGRIGEKMAELYMCNHKHFVRCTRSARSSLREDERGSRPRDLMKLTVQSRKKCVCKR